jgi:type VI secretion system protein ImpH
MSTTQRHVDTGMIAALCREPGRFSFFQAVELLLAWLADCHQVPRRQALDRLVRFENSRDLAFPTGDLGAVDIASEPGAPPHAVLTTLFMGLTGTHGALPHYYTARLAEDRDGGTQALLDVFSNRFVRHFHAAWRKNRPELPSLDGESDDLLPLLMALSGNTTGTPVEESLAAFYVGAFQQRPASAAMLQNVLGDFFRLPVTVTPNVGYWHTLLPHQVCRLGTSTAVLDGRMALGGRLWRRDGRVRLKFGPLDKATFNSLLPDGANVPRLRGLLAMFHMPRIDFEIVLVLRAADVRPIVLGQGFRLGYDTFMVSKPGIEDRQTRYLLSTAGEKP